MKKSLKIALLVAGVILSSTSCGKKVIENKIISTVREDYFSVEQTATIGKILDTITENGKWTYTEEGMGLLVEFEGERNGKPLKLVFYVTNFMGEMVFRLNGFLFGDSYLTSETDIEAVPNILYQSYLDERGK